MKQMVEVYIKLAELETKKEVGYLSIIWSSDVLGFFLRIQLW